MRWADREQLSYQPGAEGDQWGQTWQSAWFHVKGTVPADWKGKYVIARIDVEGEVLVVNDDGSPRLGLTNGSVFDANYAKDVMHLFPEAAGGETVDMWFEAAANSVFGITRVVDTEFLEDDSKLRLSSW